MDYSIEMQVGILLHRKIDSYTDSHPIFKKSTKRLHSNYSHYSGVIVDIFYDHFLAKNWRHYSDVTLKNYTLKFYELLETHYDLMPEKFQKLSPYLIQENWLLSYAEIEGITKVLKGLDRRTNLKSKMSSAAQHLLEHYELFEREFTGFFKDLEHYTKNELQLLESKYLL